MWIPKGEALTIGRRLFEARRLLEEIRYSESSHLNSDKCNLLIYSFIKSYFSYCPFTLMFCNRKSMKKVNKIQERYLRLITNNYEPRYDLAPPVLKFSNEVCKCLNGLSPE